MPTTSPRNADHLSQKYIYPNVTHTEERVKFRFYLVALT